MTKRRHLMLSKCLLGRTRRNKSKRNALISVFRLDSFRSLDLMGVGFPALGASGMLFNHWFIALFAFAMIGQKRSLDLATSNTSRKF